MLRGKFGREKEDGPCERMFDMIASSSYSHYFLLVSLAVV